MNITLNSDCNKLILSDSNISDFLTNPENYTSATITTNYNCCSSGDISCDITVEYSNKFCVEINSDYAYDYDRLLVDNGSGGTVSVIRKKITIASSAACNNTDYSVLITEITNNYLNLLSQNVIVTTNYLNGKCYLCIESADQGTINPPLSIHGLASEPEGTNFEIANNFTENVTINYNNCITKTIGVNTLYLDSNSQYNLDKYNDGVYTITVEILTTNGETITIKSCYTVLCNHKCMIGNKMEELKEVNDDAAIKLYLVYTALLNGNNCECDCSKLCEMYEYLLILLGEINNFNCDGC